MSAASMSLCGPRTRLAVIALRMQKRCISDHRTSIPTRATACWFWHSPCHPNWPVAFSVMLNRRCYARSSKDPPSGTTFYDDLGVDSMATGEEIRHAYLDISKKFHPDVRPGDEEALKRFQKASEAYNMLSNPRLRIQYDKGKLGKKISVAEREGRSHRVSPIFK